MRNRTAAFSCLIMACAPATGTFAHHETQHGGKPEQLGDVVFPVACNAAAIREPLYQKHPNHPGVAHCLIHTCDYFDLAGKGLPFARVYGGIAPSVPHALHMPSHIFLRVGLWKERVESNRAACLAAKAELKESTLGIGTIDALHAMDYLVCARLQPAQTDFQIKTVNATAAREHHAKLQQLTAEREIERPELARGKAFLASR
jgi:hypothetical protein